VNIADQTIHTPRLTIEPIVAAHASQLYALLQPTELYTYIPQEPPISVEQLEKRYRVLERRVSGNGEEIWLNYAVRFRESGLYAGTLQATILTTKKAYIAYEVFPEYWRRGIAKEGCTALIEFLIESYGLATLAAHVDTRNVASWSLLESLGFSRTETIHAADTFKGSVSDEFVYTLET
jgi:RimJ/RimL family protein N-acetyltransferase